jgi:LEA14-like dessication related protein
MRLTTPQARWHLMAIAFSLLYPLAALAQVPKPTAKVTGFDIEEISLRDVTFLFDVSVQNPYPLDLCLEAMRLTFFVEGAQVAQVQTAKGFTVKARGEETSRFHAALRYEDVLAAVKNYAEKDYLNTLVKSEIVIPLPKIPGLPSRLTFAYDFKSKIPALQPHISITHFTIEQPSSEAVGQALAKAGRDVVNRGAATQAFKDVLAGKTPRGSIQPKDLDIPLTVSFDIELTNETRAPLRFTGLDYRFSINEEELLVGATRNIENKGNRSILHVASTFSSQALSGGLLDALRARQGSFSLVGSTSIKLPDEIRKEPLKLAFTEAGSFLLP